MSTMVVHKKLHSCAIYPLAPNPIPADCEISRIEVLVNKKMGWPKTIVFGLGRVGVKKR